MAITRVHSFSSELGMCVTCDVILPQRVDHAQGKKLPVLWLLHGAYGNHYDWIRRTSIERYVAPYGLAVVMPSAQNSGYIDMAHGLKFYSYITKELPEMMRTFFNFSDKREDNFIAGLSMGGSGSLSIGLSMPEQYAAIGCLSAGSSVFMQECLQGELKQMFMGNHPIEGSLYDPIFNAQEIVKQGKPCPRIYHACGQDDSLLSCAQRTRDYFASVPGNPFKYVYEEDPGDHTWEFWDEHIRHFIDFLNLPAVKGEYC